MIYVFTENVFLKKGMESALYPLLVEFISLDEQDNPEYTGMKAGDVVLIDTNIYFYKILQTIANYSNDIKVVFLNNDKFRDVNFRVLYSSSWIINARVPFNELRTNVINVVTGRYRPSSSSSTLNLREIYVLTESMKGISVHEIARKSGISEKTIYNNRKSACRKLGVDKVWKVLPYSQLMANKIK